jgi:transcriptional regulator with XRE-family HTH domain
VALNRLAIVKSDLKEAFGNVIRELRESKTLTQQEVADYANMDRTYLSDLERGKFYPTLNIVYKLAEVLKIKPSVLIEKVDSEFKL